MKLSQKQKIRLYSHHDPDLDIDEDFWPILGILLSILGVWTFIIHLLDFWTFGFLIFGLVFGGTQAPPVLAATEEYDGTNWTAGGALILARHGLGAAGTSNTAALVFGGNPVPSGSTEGYDGTSWSTRPGLANALSSGAAGGTSTSAFIAGGRGSPPGPTAGVTTTEEFTGETTTANIKDFTATQS